MTATTAEGFSLITAIRYDPLLKETNNGSAWQVLPFHLDRLRTSAANVGWTKAIETLGGAEGEKKFHELCESAVRNHHATSNEDEPVVVRGIINEDGTLSTTTFPYDRRPNDHLVLSTFNPTTDAIAHPDAVLTIKIDTVPTPSSQFTQNKTSRRPHYDAARTRAGIVDRREKKEVLLFNEAGEVTECSITNVYFWRNGKWVTPKKETGCLPGVARRWMLENGRAVEGTVRKEEVQDGELVLLSNGLYIAQLGRVDLSPV